MLAQKAQKVAGEDTLDVLSSVAAARQRLRQRDQISEAVEVHGGLLRPVASIEIGADTYMSGVACDLAYVIDVLTDFFHLQVEILRFGPMVSPAMNHHDGIKGHTDHCASLDQRADL